MSDGSDGSTDRIGWFRDRFRDLTENIARIVKGKQGAIELALVCMTAEGHLLIDDVPGTGKTTLARALSESVSGRMQRIQFTPDLLPSDVTGLQIFNAGSNEFEFYPGPVFANVVLADEINRASPKTQSSLLEVMEERQVSVDGVARPVKRPFVVIATQNPVEMDGTYHLPEAQIDRFMMSIQIGYPDHTAERSIVENRTAGRTELHTLEPVLSIDHIESMIDVASDVAISPAISEYIIAIASATRSMPELRLGVSPRGSIAMAQAAQARAASQGRAWVTADDIKVLAPHVLGHRMLLNPEAELSGHTPQSLLEELMAAIGVPQERVS